MQGLYFNGRQIAWRADLPFPQRAAGEALVAVHMAGVCGTDLEILAGYAHFTGILGHEFVGHVVEANDARWLGKRVVGEINIGCGTCRFCRMGIPSHCEHRRVIGIRDHDGAFAEYVAVPEANLHEVPAHIPDRQAVFTEPLAAAFRVLEQVHLGPSMRVAVLGVGKLGTLVAQAVATSGATVFALTRHPGRVGFLEDQSIRLLRPNEATEKSFDMVAEVTGSQAGLARALQLTRPLGTVVLKSSTHDAIPLNLTPATVDEITLVGSRCGPFGRALQALAENEVQVEPLIDGLYPLKQGATALDKASRPGVMKILLQVQRASG